MFPQLVAMILSEINDVRERMPLANDANRALAVL